ncbi:hypothetical protein ACIQU5_10790 [Streptomyces sp. NPDC090306]|uniref:hypothetical protein n=1 Tax=Streptomyces sp. NPDC090306 TaxID=3365961 RepID=UPI00380BD07F
MSVPPGAHGSDAPATREVPLFDPVRVDGAREQLRRLVRHRRRAVALGLVVTAAALVAAGHGTSQQPGGQRESAPHARTGAAPGAALREHRRARTVTAPVRIADAATVRLLRPGDRVDVIASEPSAAGGAARVVAHGARVTRVPELLDGTAGLGALVLLAVPRADAAGLVGAGATARLAVTLC